uniref:Membrane transporter protein n=1 Tax=Tetradesmus obliquus TaxID=3088 RepID=A0A383WJP0_TETOB|eukprot:jgi/Sobl393_1/1087/SZX77675.1
MATISCIAVLVLGNLLGAIVRGITGFGSAILNLCVWVVFTCLGFDAGTLQQAVVAECVCSEICALPLLRLTKAASTCDWRLTSSLFIFASLGAPVGAALLTTLPVRGVEFVMACVLVLVIGAHCHVLQHMQRWLHRTRRTVSHDKQCSDISMAYQAVSSDSSCTLQQQAAFGQVLHGQQQPATTAAAGPAADTAVGSKPAGQELQLLATQPSLEEASAAAPAVEAAQPAHAVTADAELYIPHQHRPGLGESQPCSSSSSLADDTRHDHKSSDCNHSSDSSDEETALLTTCQAASCSNGGSSGSSGSSSIGQSSASRGAACSRWQGCRQAVKQWWAHANEPEQRRATLRLLMYGSLAGSVSGAMAGMTGMGGPPLMMLYEKLQVKKDTVRGCNAVLSVLQFRVIAYALTGSFTRDDLALYVAVSVAGLVGLCLGSHLASRMDQATFSKVMVALMLLCCVLLFASSAGLTGS